MSMLQPVPPKSSGDTLVVEDVTETTTSHEYSNNDDDLDVDDYDEENEGEEDRMINQYYHHHTNDIKVPLLRQQQQQYPPQTLRPPPRSNHRITAATTANTVSSSSSLLLVSQPPSMDDDTPSSMKVTTGPLPRNSHRSYDPYSTIVTDEIVATLPPPLSFRSYIPWFRTTNTNPSTTTTTTTTTATAHASSSSSSSSSSSNSSYCMTLLPNYHTLQLLFGICGIYISFLYYGNLQEDIFRYTSSTIDTTTGTMNGTKFTQAWFLQAAESFINGCVGYIGILLYGSGFIVATTNHNNNNTNNNNSATKTSSGSSVTANASGGASTTNTTGTTTSLVQHHPFHSPPEQSSPTSVAILPNHKNKNMASSIRPSVLSLTKLASDPPFKLPTLQPSLPPPSPYLYHKVPHWNFCISGMAQVSAKACTSIALSYGLSYPIATLTKSGKMAPVMIGSIYYGNATYSVRDYVQVMLIIFGTAIVSFGSSSKHHSSSSSLTSQKHESILGVLYILISLLFDGITAGYQKRFQHDMSMINVQPKSYDYMYYTNIYMFCTAFMIALLSNEIPTGMTFLYNNPVLFYQIIQFTICSAIGQSFIFYTLANFDPLVLSTVTTTRKIFSVLLSIFLKGHSLSYMGWTGITIACSGILSEMHHKMGKKKHTN